MYHTTKNQKPARQTGSVTRHRGVWTARVTFTTTDGERHETRVRAASKSAAGDERDTVLRELREWGADEYFRRKQERRHPLTPSKAETGEKTFGELVDHFKEKYACAVERVDDRRFIGMKSWRWVRGQIDILVSELGADTPLSDLTFDRVRDLRITRLRKPVQMKGWKNSKPRSLANVQRLLGILRRMCNVALRKKWMGESPFAAEASPQDRLIDASQETERERVLTPTEEKRLLKQFSANTPMHVVMLALLDTGARIGELVRVRSRANDDGKRLRWRDVQFRDGVMNLSGVKTETPRSVGITPRLKLALLAIKPTDAKPDDFVFPDTTYNVARGAFMAACTAAKVAAVTIHDLRHTRATRWIQGGLSESEVGHLLGHSKKSHVTRRYINPAGEVTIERSLAAAARFTKEHGGRKKAAEAVN